MNLRRGFALALAIGALFAVGCSDLGAPLRLAPAPSVSVTALDFGTVAVGGSATRSVVVTNAGTADFAGLASVGCAPYTVESGGGAFTVPPGGQHEVVVRFTPPTTGSFPCALELGEGVAAVPVAGQASNQLPGSQCEVSPAVLEFGSLAVGADRVLVFKVRNPGTAPTTLDVVSDRPTFTLLSGGGPSSLAPGDSLVVTVSFSPTAGGRDSCLIATGPGCPSVRGRGAATTISFASDLRPLLNSRGCTGCHGWTAASQLVGVTTAGYAPAKYIQPFSLTGSVLYGKITNSGQYGGPMPQAAPLMPVSERNKFRDWILEGAADN